MNIGIKHDAEKPRMDLLDPDFLEGTAQVLTFGARKYEASNWRKGINTSRLIAAAYRHLGEVNKGNDIDPESGIPHVYHLACNIQFLSWMLKNRPDMDDRWVSPVKIDNAYVPRYLKDTMPKKDLELTALESQEKQPDNFELNQLFAKEDNGIK